MARKRKGTRRRKRTETDDSKSDSSSSSRNSVSEEAREKAQAKATKKEEEKKALAKARAASNRLKVAALDKLPGEITEPKVLWLVQASFAAAARNKLRDFRVQLANAPATDIATAFLQDVQPYKDTTNLSQLPWKATAEELIKAAEMLQEWEEDRTKGCQVGNTVQELIDKYETECKFSKPV